MKAYYNNVATQFVAAHYNYIQSLIIQNIREFNFTITIVILQPYEYRTQLWYQLYLVVIYVSSQFLAAHYLSQFLATHY